MVSFSSPVSTEFSRRNERLSIFGVLGGNKEGSIPVCAWKRSSVFSATKVPSGSPAGSLSLSSLSGCFAPRGLPLDSPKEAGALGDAKLVSLPAVPRKPAGAFADAKLVSLPAVPEKLAGAFADAKLVSLPAVPEKAAGALGDAKLVSLPEGAGKALPNAEKPDPRAPKPAVEALPAAKGEALDGDLFAGIAKGEGELAAAPKALAVKVC